MVSKLNLLDLSVEEIQEEIKDYSRENFRSLQIFKWIYRGINNIDEMTDLSKDLRSKLKERFYIFKPQICEKLVSQIDNTKKYLMKMEDGNIIETVLMSYKHGFSICLSSQVGCKMGCKFCASTHAGFVRNLTAGEIIGQILSVLEEENTRIGNIVLMGIGEPLDNYKNVLKFLRLINDKNSLNIGYRHISLSTCGVVTKIKELAKENLPITLSISLHAPNDKIREEIMPINKKYSIAEILDACKIYTKSTKRRITFEYALIDGVNDSENDARELAKMLKNILCHVNLIPINSVEGGKYNKGNVGNIKMFKKMLEYYRINVTIRRELGSDISAACGQLRRSFYKNS